MGLLFYLRCFYDVLSIIHIFFFCSYVCFVVLCCMVCYSEWSRLCCFEVYYVLHYLVLCWFILPFVILCCVVFGYVFLLYFGISIWYMSIDFPYVRSFCVSVHDTVLCCFALHCHNLYILHIVLFVLHILELCCCINFFMLTALFCSVLCFIVLNCVELCCDSSYCVAIYRVYCAE